MRLQRLYSYTWLENRLGTQLRNTERVLPEYQHLEVGDTVRLTPKERYNLALEVALIEPARALVLRTPAQEGDRLKTVQEGYPDGTWAFVLEPLDEQTTRLIVRWRSYYRPTLPGLLFNQYGLEPVLFIIERKMLLGIQKRAEWASRRAPTTAKLLETKRSGVGKKLNLDERSG